MADTRAPEQAPAGTLTAQDRCDACHSAAAIAIAVLLDGSRLLLCGHHADTHTPALLASGATVTRPGQESTS
jgi:hypothetical protein